MYVQSVYIVSCRGQPTSAAMKGGCGHAAWEVL